MFRNSMSPRDTKDGHNERNDVILKLLQMFLSRSPSPCCAVPPRRHAGVLETSVHSLCAKQPGSHGDYAVFLSHDLCMLRLIETFSESAPQLVLMLTIILQRGQLDPVTGGAHVHAAGASHLLVL